MILKYFFKSLFIVVSLYFLLYLVLPFGPKSIDDFSDLPNSVRSRLDGDTVQVPNLKAFFSNNYRGFATNYYYKEYWRLSRFPFSPIKLNHPPEYAFYTIKDQTQSTYLEEYTYPFRGSLYINGLEPLDEITKEPRYPAGSYFSADGHLLETKVTVRYYPTSPFSRVVVWIGINISIVLLCRLGNRIIKNA